MRKNLPPRELFDDDLAKNFIGKSLLIGITNADSEGKMISRSQIFGVVTIADRIQGICIQDIRTSEEIWFRQTREDLNPRPLESTEIVPITREVVNNPDYFCSWTWTFPAAKENRAENATEPYHSFRERRWSQWVSATLASSLSAGIKIPSFCGG